MGILKEAKNEQAFLKAGLFGNAGSGKTTTASYLAMGIANAFGNKKPVAFFETEAGSDFLVDRFRQEGITLLRVKSHALADLIEAVKEAKEACSCMIVDSITHVWNEVCEAKLRAVNSARERKAKNENRKFYPIEKLEFQHWADVKREWAKWTELFLNTNLHIIVCGRAGGTWEFETNEDTGKKELQKTGTKMKAEGEFGYEPSLLIEMERVQKGATPGSGWLHRAHVLKDRTDTINGLTLNFEKPKGGYKTGDWKRTLKPFEPVFKSLNIGGQQHTFDSSRTSEELFPGNEGESDAARRAKRVEIALEEMQGILTAIWPGQDATSKQAKGTTIEGIFGCHSWAAVAARSLEELERGVKIMLKLKANLQARQEPLESLDALKEQIVAASTEQQN